MLHKAWNSKGEMPFCFPRSSIKFQGHTVQNITDFDPNWAFPDYRPVAAFKSIRFALFNHSRSLEPWSDNQPQIVLQLPNVCHISLPVGRIDSWGLRLNSVIIFFFFRVTTQNFTIFIWVSTVQCRCFVFFLPDVIVQQVPAGDIVAYME